MRTSRHHRVKPRVPQMVRLLHLFVLAVFGVIGFGAASPPPAYAAVAHVSDAAHSTRSVSVSLSSPEWRRVVETPIDDPGSLEANLDDDDDVDGRDAHVSRTDPTLVAFDDTWSSPRAARPFRSESSIDPSRHAARPAFARGPPSLRA